MNAKHSGPCLHHGEPRSSCHPVGCHRCGTDAPALFVENERLAERVEKLEGTLDAADFAMREARHLLIRYHPEPLCTKEEARVCGTCLTLDDLEATLLEITALADAPASPASGLQKDKEKTR